MYPITSCQMDLKNKELWNQFHQLETEMIITKSGRRMFPSLHVQIKNLDPNAHYCIYLEMTQISKCRYKYSSSNGWCPAGSEENQLPPRVYLHPDSPNSGEHWMSQPVSFNRIKLTNTPAPPSGHLVLSSMHKYQPKIVIAQTVDVRSVHWAPSTSFVFPETRFVAVTAYQNEKITKLKIDNNPFAKGFRMNGQAKCKKRHRTEDSEIIDVISTDEERETRVEDSPSPKRQHIETYKNDNNCCTKQEPIKIKIEEMSPNSDKCLASSSAQSSPNYEPANVVLPISVPHMYNPFYFNYQYFYQPQVWSPIGFHQSCTSMPQDLSIKDVVIKPKKLTDFSIRAITGLS